MSAESFFCALDGKFLARGCIPVLIGKGSMERSVISIALDVETRVNNDYGPLHLNLLFANRRNRTDSPDAGYLQFNSCIS